MLNFSILNSKKVVKHHLNHQFLFLALELTIMHCLSWPLILVEMLVNGSRETCRETSLAGGFQELKLLMIPFPNSRQKYLVDISHSFQAPKNMRYTGLKIMASQRTMSVLIADLTGQTLILPVILTGHFWIRTFYYQYSCRLMLYNAVLISFSLAFFAALH